MENSRKTLQDIIDIMSPLKKNTMLSNATFKINDEITTNNGKDVEAIYAEFYEDDGEPGQFDGKDCDGKCVVLWIEYEDSFERLVNKDLEDIIMIWKYMNSKTQI